MHVDTCCRVARAQRCMSEQLVLLSTLCALEAVPLRFNYFAAFWRDVAESPVSHTLLYYSMFALQMHGVVSVKIYSQRS